MKRAIELTELALRDVAKAFAWYEAQRTGLGAEFLEAVDDLLDRISQNPQHFPTVARDARLASVRRFPYSIPFREEGAQIVILGILHSRTDPREMKRRTR